MTGIQEEKRRETGSPSSAHSGPEERCGGSEGWLRAGLAEQWDLALQGGGRRGDLGCGAPLGRRSEGLGE